MTFINEISKTFNQYATTYERAAKVQQEVGGRLLERLQYLKINPRYILDLGCGTGHFSRELTRLYPKARVISIDSAFLMLACAKKKHSWRCKWSLAAADMHRLPFADGLFDLVFANQVIHWGTSLESVFGELNRVMNVNACFMFTTLGPDTFHEMRSCWAKANKYAHVNPFLDMHEVGDALLREYFLDPVMDMEWLTIHYNSVQDLVRALKNQGVRNINSARNPGLTGNKAWRSFQESYEHFKTASGKYPLSYEVVFGHSWKGGRRKTDQGVEEAFVPINSIKRVKKSELNTDEF